MLATGQDYNSGGENGEEHAIVFTFVYDYKFVTSFSGENDTRREYELLLWQSGLLKSRLRSDVRCW